jgi:hypothetical protein
MTPFHFRIIVPVILLLFLFAPPGPAHATMTYLGYNSSPAAMGDHTRIGMVRARNIALGLRPGRVTRESFVRQNGRKAVETYEFKIRNSSGRYSVGVDANTGRVLHNRREAKRVRRTASLWSKTCYS